MKHYVKIDGLRFIAIALVLIHHFSYSIGRSFTIGYYGVDLFFVISGFLITSILYYSKGNFKCSYKNFIGRRTLRIFPIYYLTVFILFILNLEVVRNYLITILTYTFNYTIAFKSLPLTPVSHFWSLCVEEQFYLFWPFIVLPLRNNYRYLLWTIVIIVIFSFSQLVIGYISWMNPYYYLHLFTRMGSIGLGALAAILVITNNLPINLLKDKFFEYLMFGILIYSFFDDSQLKYLAFSLCSFYFVLKSVHSGFNLRFINSILENKTIRYIGTISYGIYIYHLPLGYYISKYLFDPIYSNNDFWNFFDYHHLSFLRIFYWHKWLIQIPLYSALSIFIAYISYKTIELPILKLKNQYFSNQD
jgi:peptidoglycan/LPS O-acetylase OafA/YrhL